MKRISVVGSSGSGKTTLARAIAEQRRIPHLELDSVYHQPNWEPLSDADFRTAVEPFVATESWVIDGNWKLLLTYDGRQGRMKYPPDETAPRLFNLKEDPLEENDLAKGNPEKVERLSRKLDQWWAVTERKPLS